MSWSTRRSSFSSSSRGNRCSTSSISSCPVSSSHPLGYSSTSCRPKVRLHNECYRCRGQNPTNLRNTEDSLKEKQTKHWSGNVQTRVEKLVNNCFYPFDDKHLIICIMIIKLKWISNFYGKRFIWSNKSWDVSFTYEMDPSFFMTIDSGSWLTGLWSVSLLTTLIIFISWRTEMHYDHCNPARSDCLPVPYRQESARNLPGCSSHWKVSVLFFTHHTFSVF